MSADLPGIIILPPGGSGSGSGGHIIEEEGVPLPQEATLNFVGAGVTATDAGGKTVVTIPGSAAAPQPIVWAMVG